MTAEPDFEHDNVKVPFWKPVLFAALAGGMAWGIRGQYGHETGAMIAGLLVSLVLTHLLCPRVPIQLIVKAAAMGTLAMGIGGSMTYGQTLGLTQDGPLVGNADAWRWGMLGAAVKGSLWIGFCGLFLGAGLSGKSYRSLEILGVMVVAVALAVLGIFLLNTPFDIEAKKLPAIYFSDAWYWEPDGELKPRPELWGGLLFAFVALTAWFGFVRKDTLARNMAGWGFLGGALGFPAGQYIQSYNSWNPGFFEEKLLGSVAGYMNWWNIMETTFGTVMGAVLGLGLWLNRRRIAAELNKDTFNNRMPIPIELVLVAAHIVLLFYVEFRAIPYIDFFYDHGLIMVILPMVAIVSGRITPYLVLFPITLMPIAGKTLKQLAFGEEAIPVFQGWAFYFALPMLVALGCVAFFYIRHQHREVDNNFARMALFVTAWTYFLLNWAFFHFPWPWAEWTGRTTNGILFSIAVIGLTIMILFMPNTRRGDRNTRPVEAAYGDAEGEWPDHSIQKDEEV